MSRRRKRSVPSSKAESLSEKFMLDVSGYQTADEEIARTTIAGEASVAAEPGEAALDHPALRQDLETLRIRWPLGDLEPEPLLGRGTGGSDALVAAIDEEVAKPKKAMPYPVANEAATIPLLEFGGVDRQRQRQVEPSVSVTRWRLRHWIFSPAS